MEALVTRGEFEESIKSIKDALVARSSNPSDENSTFPDMERNKSSQKHMKRGDQITVHSSMSQTLQTNASGISFAQSSELRFDRPFQSKQSVVIGDKIYTCHNYENDTSLDMISNKSFKMDIMKDLNRQINNQNTTQTSISTILQNNALNQSFSQSSEMGLDGPFQVEQEIGLDQKQTCKDNG